MTVRALSTIKHNGVVYTAMQEFEVADEQGKVLILAGAAIEVGGPDDLSADDQPQYPTEDAPKGDGTKPDDEDEELQDLETMTKTELVDYAMLHTSLSEKQAGSLKKAELIEAIRNDLAEQADEDE